MIVARHGFALRVSWRNIYLAAIFGGLILLPLIEGAASLNKWTDPIFILFSLLSLLVIAMALNGVMLLISRGDTVRLLTIFRRTTFQRNDCRFNVEQTGSGRGRTTKVVATDGTRKRTICFYWLLGDLVAGRAAQKLNKQLVEA